MSALRDLFASLWAAVWLRGRLLGIRLRRLFGSGRSTEGGPDYYLAADEVPVEGRDYDPSDLPPDAAARLDAFRAELLDHVGAISAGDHPRRRVRRRTIAVAVASLLALGVAGGASALVTGSTGVPAVDRVLGIYEKLEKQKSDTSGRDARVDPSQGSAPINAVVADGSRIAISFYVADSGKICSLAAGENNDGLGALACQMPAKVADRLAGGGVYVMATNVWGDSVVLSGLASSDTVSLGGQGPGGALQVSLGRAWESQLPDVEALRPFVAVGSLSDETSQDAQDLMVLNPDLYTFDVRTDSGD